MPPTVLFPYFSGVPLAFSSLTIFPNIFHLQHKSMAVESPHLNLLTTQLLIGRELEKAVDNPPAIVGNGAEKELTFFSSNCPATFYNPAAASSGSGLTAAAGICKKRPREPMSFLSSLAQQHMLDVDRLLTHHTEKVRVELAERLRQLEAAAAEERGILKRLMKAKEDEVERAKHLNWALEDQVRSLAAENQAWRELARTNEAAANLLRNNLEQVLAAELRRGNGEVEKRCSDAGDAESCYCGESVTGPSNPPSLPKAKARACRSCGEGAPAVLLLPCRHLCLCSSCGPVSNSCPICKCSQKGIVNVNLS